MSEMLFAMTTPPHSLEHQRLHIVTGHKGLSYSNGSEKVALVSTSMHKGHGTLVLHVLHGQATTVTIDVDHSLLRGWSVVVLLFACQSSYVKPLTYNPTTYEIHLMPVAASLSDAC